MSLGNIGIVKPSNVDLSDIEIFYSYAQDRSVKPSNFIQIETTDAIEKRFVDNISSEIFQGFYTLKLSSTIFSDIGFYTIYIRPKQIKCTILDCGVLSQLPDQKGLIFDINSSDFSLLRDKISPGALTGFRIDYLSDSGSIIPNNFTTIAFSNRCEVISQSSVNGSQKSVVYKFNDTGSLMFVSVTPSTSPSIKPSAQPFIGTAGQKVIISNTFFDPQVIEIELTEYDLKKIATLINGERTLNIDTGVENIYDENREILEQSVIYDIKDENKNPLYKVKQKNIEIDETETWDSITENVQ